MSYTLPQFMQQLGAQANMRGQADERRRPRFAVPEPHVPPPSQQHPGAPPDQTGQSVGGMLGGSVGGAGGAIGGFFAGLGLAPILGPFAPIVGAITGGSLLGAAGTVAGQEAGAAATGEREELEEWKKKAYGPGAPKADYSQQRAQPFIQAGAALPGQLTSAYVTNLATQSAQPPPTPPPPLSPTGTLGGVDIASSGGQPVPQAILDLPPGVNLGQQAYLAEQAGGRYTPDALAQAAQSDEFLWQNPDTNAIELVEYPRPIEPPGQYYEGTMPGEGFAVSLPGGAPGRLESFTQLYADNPEYAYEWAMGQAAQPGIASMPAGMPENLWAEYQGTLPMEQPGGLRSTPELTPPTAVDRMEPFGGMEFETTGLSPRVAPGIVPGGIGRGEAAARRAATRAETSQAGSTMLFPHGEPQGGAPMGQLRGESLLAAQAPTTIERLSQLGIEAPTGVDPTGLLPVPGGMEPLDMFGKPVGMTDAAWRDYLLRMGLL